MSDLPIYNCHIHIFTRRHVPRYFLRLLLGPYLGTLLSILLRWKPLANLFVWLVAHIVPFSNNDVLERQARFFARGQTDSQEENFRYIQKQYPDDTTFVILPMDMAFMDLGTVDEPMDEQHRELLRIARASQERAIPFYAVDPRREDVVNRARDNLGRHKFRGVKIYPNLGYRPDEKPLMEVYALCEERGVPVMTHCSPGGVWKYGLSYVDRIRYGHPGNYEQILQRFPRLRLCLAHFGGGQEWAKHLQSKTPREGEERAWVRWIADMIRSGHYPNLYTDIAYTVFAPKIRGMYVDYFDYLKVLLADQHIREHVLFGSDYYMVEREAMTEKEVSILLRSRLGEDLYFQIAHHNPKRYLGLV